MDILILGGGGREHALAWKIAQSPLCDRLVCAPGNAGIAELADCIALDPENPEQVAAWAKGAGIGLVVVGPEAPLAAGVADALRAAGVPCFGPSAAAARLESSKTFTKEVADAVGAPTAAWARFTDAAEARAYVEAQGAPIVIKADGLAAGKGVVVAETVAQAVAAVDDMLSGAFGAAGASVVIEEFMAGEEASLFAISDGTTVKALGVAQDHKRAHDGDQGPNTGGMGAYSPAPVLTPEMEADAMARIVRPVVEEMARRGTPYQGVLYAGLMLTETGPRLVEFNVRFGDPECQVLMMRLESDLVPLLLACATGEGLEALSVDWHDEAAATVVIAANGYPGSYAKGETILGIPQAEADPLAVVFHAGTKAAGPEILSNGGRVLNVTARGASLAEAVARAYRAVARIDWPGGFHRTDIGARELNRGK
ncbi:MAG: phosphoribosylamine--glycine ligase [Pseudomonadota bacterium]|nr:phosphoribosylamine--glycine ligase [Pseudomonadota bacterium]MEE3101680.1 phosphoribosylamine--glycine ligase [Pseudomonadota bacterium]